MIDRLSSALTRWCTRYIPDAYVIAVVLSVIVFAAALLATSHGPIALVSFWGSGFWGFAEFTFHMAMVILTGYVVADAPRVKRLLSRLAAIPKTPRAAIALMAVVSMTLGWINWGLSIVASALLAQRIGKRRMGVDYRLLIASAYLGIGCIWHAGLSASAPLTSSDPGQPFVTKYLKAAVPVTETVFAPFNLLLGAAVMIAMTVVAIAIHPSAPVEAPPDALDEDEEKRVDVEPAEPPRTPAEWLERTPFVNIAIGLGVFAYLPWFIYTQGIRKISIGHVNLLFFGLGALLHVTPASLLRSAERSGRNVWGVLLQFGLYAGAAGILDKAGLAARIADGFTRVASPSTFPLIVVWYTGIVNYLVPSGGAKWFIEVQYLADAARSMGVPLGRTIVAYAWGDMLTDIIQPFWAIPLLAVARLRFRDIMGYCLIFFLVYVALVSAAFLGWGYLS